MNYTREQLDEMEDLEGSNSYSKLKIDEPDRRVWLLARTKFGQTFYECLIENMQEGRWRTIQRYPV